MKKQDRCTGHCCRSFSLPLSPAELLEEAAKSKNDPSREPDIERVKEMVIYLGQFHTNPTQLTDNETWVDKGFNIARRGDAKPPRRALSEMFGPKDDPRGSHWYACRHVQLNGDCGIYDQRPALCRKYPNGQECRFVECTWSKKGQEKHFKKEGRN